MLQFKIATLQGIPRENNFRSDTVARLATGDQPPLDSSIYRLMLASSTVSSNTFPLEQILLLSYGPN